MRDGRRGSIRALALAPVYLLIVGLVFAEPPTSTAVQWLALLGPALIYGALAGSWWSCLVPVAVFAAGVAVEVMEATVPSFGGEIPLGLVLLVGSLGAFVGVSAGVATGKAARRRTG